MPRHCHRHHQHHHHHEHLHHYLLHYHDGTLMCCAVKTQAKKATRPTKPKESAQLLRLSGEPSGRVAYNMLWGMVWYGRVWYVTHFRAHCSPFTIYLSLSLVFLASCPSASPLVANFGSSLDSSRVVSFFAGHKNTLYARRSS